MKRNDQELQGGDNSQNYQANGDINVNGLTYDQVEKLFMTMFKANFYDLGKDLNRLIDSRAEEIINEFLKKIIREAPEKLSSAKDPDLRYVIYEAQKSYVRSGDKELQSHLVDMLVERTKNDSNEFVKMSYNEALSIIPKLSNRQIQLITIMFVIRDLAFNPSSVANLEDIYHYFLSPFLVDVGNRNLDDMNFNHINFTGCSSFTNKQNNLVEILRYKFHYKYAADEITDFINKYDDLKHFSMLWDVSKYKYYELTSVGIVIALSNIKRKLGHDIDAKIFLS